MKKLNLTIGATLAASFLAACNLPPAPSPPGGAPANPRTFVVTIDSPEGAPGPLSPGVFVIHKDGTPLFDRGQMDRGQGLEGIAEDGDPSALGANLSNATVFNTPVGDDGPGPATPGKSYQFTFTAEPGDRLSFATMYVQSNDGFYAPGSTGLALFEGNVPVTGNVTDQILLWDAGTEVNQAPGEGADQAPRQSGPNVGASESEPIQLIEERDNFDYQNNIRVTIEAS